MMKKKNKLFVIVFFLRIFIFLNVFVGGIPIKYQIPEDNVAKLKYSIEIVK